MKAISDIRRDNLVALIEDETNGKQREAAERLEMSDSLLSQYVRGHKSIGTSAARKIEKAFGYPENWMDGVHVTDHSLQPSPFPAPGDMRAREIAGQVELPVMNVRGGMGRAGLAPEYEEVVKRMTISASWLFQNVTCTGIRNLCLITGFGDSMFPTFTDGDVLLVDRGINEVRIDAVYVLMLNDELYIKRMQRRPDGTLLMISDNKNYQPYLIQQGDRDKFTVEGRVLLAWNVKRL